MGRLAFLFLTFQIAAPARDLRIAVFGLFHPSELTVKAIPGGTLRISVAAGDWSLEDAQTARLRAGRSGVLCMAGAREGSSEIVKVAGTRGPAEFVLGVPGKIERRFVGTLQVRVRAGVLVAVVITGLEAAVEAVVAAESDPGTTIEALKAQAIAARSFYFASPARHHGYQFCDTTHCQFLRAPPKHTGAAAAAVAATRGQTLRYSNTPLAAMFSSSCGGQTRTLAEAGMIDDDGYPYYAVQCEACRKSAPEWRSSVPVKYSALLEDRSDAHRIELGRILGWSVLPGYNYKTDRAGDHILVHGRGSGHGIGLCQRGASAMAASGADYRTILRYYYANTVIGFVE